MTARVLWSHSRIPRVQCSVSLVHWDPNFISNPDSRNCFIPELIHQQYMIRNVHHAQQNMFSYVTQIFLNLHTTSKQKGQTLSVGHVYVHHMYMCVLHTYIPCFDTLHIYILYNFCAGSANRRVKGCRGDAVCRSPKSQIGLCVHERENVCVCVSVLACLCVLCVF